MAVHSSPALDGDAGAPAILTREGRRLLAQRAQRLRTRLLTELRAALDQDQRDLQAVADYQRAAAELHRLTWLLEHATIAEDLPDDPALVELGEAVTVQDEHGGVDRFLIVHPAEAPLDHTRISTDAPLARALLGRRVGEEVEVDAPGGTYRYRILAAERAPARRRHDADAPMPP
jgi:transcription elongation GreA/GreB family factor